MTLPIIQSLWIGSELSKIEQLSISSFLKNGHQFHLYTYGDIKNIPEGTIVKDANEILSNELIFTYNNGSYAGFADWFRWELLFKKGGFWVDTDVVCLKPFLFKEDIIFGIEDGNRVCPAILGFPANHEICSFLANLCKNPNTVLPYDSKKTRKLKFKRRLYRKGRESIKWGECGGPEGFTKALKHFNMLKLAKPFTYFFPIHYSHWKCVYDKTLSGDINLFNNTYAIHLWNEMSRREKGFDKNETFHQDSLLEQLKKKYLVK